MRVRETEEGRPSAEEARKEHGAGMAEDGRDAAPDGELSDYKGDINLMCFEAETVPMYVCSS